MKKRKMNNHTTFFVLSRTALASIYVRVHQTEWEDRQRIPIVGSQMEKKEASMRILTKVLRSVFTKKRRKKKNQRMNAVTRVKKWHNLSV
jgi:hypothetical protein